MTTFELAGQAMIQSQDGSRSLAQAVAQFFSRRRPEQTSLAGVTFLEQEPGLANEAKLPEYMRTI